MNEQQQQPVQPNRPESGAKKNPLGIIIAVIILLVIAGIVYAYMQSKTGAPAVDDNSQGSDQIMKAEVDSYTLAEIAQHNSAEDCWFAISGRVYDVTGFIASGTHGGGDAILLGCGKDATSLFEDRPNGSGPHSETARSYLPNFEIGILATE